MVANNIRSIMKEHPIYTGYYITQTGRVYSNKRGAMIEKSLCINTVGYPSISLWYNGKQYYKTVHRLVAETYIENPDNLPQVNHIDKDRTNNNVENLEWCDNQQNSEHSLAKSYKIKTPTGEIVEVFNLRKYCRENNLYSGHLATRGRCKGYQVLM